MRVELRHSFPEDFIAIQGKPPPYRCRCLTALVEDQVIGIGGLVFYPNGAVVGSVLMTDEAKKYPVAIHRAGVRTMQEARMIGLKEVTAEAQPGNPAAERWLLRLGFKPENRDGHALFVWRREDAQ